MPKTVKDKKEITVGDLFGKSGHETRWAADSKDAPKTKKESDYVYKKNKHGEKASSEFEVALSTIYRCATPDLTFDTDLVVDDKNNTIGVVSHLEKSFEDFTQFDKSPGLAKRLTNMSEQEKKDLAEVLVMAYCLEEDDLHRKNIGFYKKGGVSRIAKIDHDMLFYQSVTSKQHIRGTNPEDLLPSNRFKVSHADMKDFPVLSSSDIHYWPTKTRRTGTSDKEYDQEMVTAFSKIGEDPTFKKAKYTAFLKFILMNPADVKNEMKARLGDKPDVVDIALDALVRRQAEIQVFLLSVPLTERANLETALNEASKSQPDNEKLKKLNACFKEIEKYNPLHVAIKTGCFAQLSLESYKHYIEELKGKSEGSPLHLAIKMGDTFAIQTLVQAASKYSVPLDKNNYLKHAIKCGDVDVYKTLLKSFKLKAPSFNKDEYVELMTELIKEKKYDMLLELFKNSDLQEKCGRVDAIEPTHYEALRTEDKEFNNFCRSLFPTGYCSYGNLQKYAGEIKQFGLLAHAVSHLETPEPKKVFLLDEKEKDPAAWLKAAGYYLKVNKGAGINIFFDEMLKKLKIVEPLEKNEFLKKLYIQSTKDSTYGYLREALVKYIINKDKEKPIKESVSVKSIDKEKPIKESVSVKSIESILTTIRDSYDLSLNQKKLAALQCVKTAVANVTSQDELRAIFDLVKNDQFKFAQQRQPSSFSWIRRIFRFEPFHTKNTSTYQGMLECIRHKAKDNPTLLKDVKEELSGISSFISSTKKFQVLKAEEENSHPNPAPGRRQ